MAAGYTYKMTLRPRKSDRLTGLPTSSDRVKSGAFAPCSSRPTSSSLLLTRRGRHAAAPSAVSMRSCHAGVADRFDGYRSAGERLHPGIRHGRLAAPIGIQEDA